MAGAVHPTTVLHPGAVDVRGRQRHGLHLWGLPGHHRLSIWRCLPRPSERLHTTIPAAGRAPSTGLHLNADTQPKLASDFHEELHVRHAAQQPVHCRHRGRRLGAQLRGAVGVVPRTQGREESPSSVRRQYDQHQARRASLSLLLLSCDPPRLECFDLFFLEYFPFLLVAEDSLGRAGLEDFWPGSGPRSMSISSSESEQHSIGLTQRH